MKLPGRLKLFLLIFILLSVAVSAQTPQIRVACVGNSITQGFGINDLRSYPQQLGLLLGSHYIVKNCGVGGTTLLKKGDFPYWKEALFLGAQDFDPQILIISLGTNDSKPQNWVYKNEFFSDYLDLIRQFRKNNRHPQIFVCIPTPVVQDNFGISNSIIHNEMTPILDSIINTAGTYVINYYENMVGKDTLFSDGVHPTAAGYKLMGKIAYDVLQQGPAGITRYFYSDKLAFEKDESVKLYWETSKGSEVALNGTKVAETDSMVVKPLQTTDYRLIAKGGASDTSVITLKYLAPGKIKSLNVFPPFLDKGYSDTTKITWTSTNGSQVTLDGQPVETNGFRLVSPGATKTYMLIARGETIDTAYITVQVIESEKINRAYLHSVTSSTSGRGFVPEAAVDGDINTFWQSGAGSSHWIKVDLGRNYIINRVVVDWGYTYAKVYHLQALNEAGQVAVLYSNLKGDGDTDDLTITGQSGETRYLRLLCLTKSNADSAYIIKELEIYGKPIPASDVKGNGAVPLRFNLGQNYPNPFNPTTLISYTLAQGGPVTLKVFDLLGKEVVTLINEYRPAGNHSVEFHAGTLPSGAYIYTIQAGQFKDSKKLILLK